VFILSEFNGMLASDLIKILQEKIEWKGDLPVKYVTGSKDNFAYPVSVVCYIEKEKEEYIELGWGMCQGDFP
jgi:hypothetical protein